MTLVARKAGTIAGLPLVAAALRRLDPGVEIEALARDGDRVAAKAKLMVIRGDARAVLAAERVALNFLGHLSGIATATAAFVDRIGDSKTRICCTRKTTPACARWRNTRSAAAAASITASASMMRS